VVRELGSDLAVLGADEIFQKASTKHCTQSLEEA
jgi:hypothetical protein